MLTDLPVPLVLVRDLLELDVRLVELLEDLVLGDEGAVLVHQVLHPLLAAVLDRPVLQLRLRQQQEGHDAALRWGEEDRRENEMRDQHGVFEPQLALTNFTQKSF